MIGVNSGSNPRALKYGYFGPDKLPQFDREFFEIPHGTKDEWLFEQFKPRMEEGNSPSADEVSAFTTKLQEIVAAGRTTRGDE